MKLNKLLSQVILADPKTLIMSRKNCHAKYVDSIVLEQNEGKLLRVFLAHHGNKLNEYDLTVGIHDHKYHLEITPICGNIYHETYVATDCNDYPKYHEWEFSSILNQEKKQVYKGKRSVRLQTTGELNKSIFIDAGVLHNVYCSGMAAWYVQEDSVIKQTTRLFTKKKTINRGGLYQEFKDRDEIINTVAEWIRDYD